MSASSIGANLVSCNASGWVRTYTITLRRNGMWGLWQWRWGRGSCLMAMVLPTSDFKCNSKGRPSLALKTWVQLVLFWSGAANKRPGHLAGNQAVWLTLQGSDVLGSSSPSSTTRLHLANSRLVYPSACQLCLYVVLMIGCICAVSWVEIFINTAWVINLLFSSTNVQLWTS